MCLNHNKNQFLEGESVRFTAKKLRIQLKIQSVRLKRKLDAGFIAQAPSGPTQKIDLILLY